MKVYTASIMNVGGDCWTEGVFTTSETAIAYLEQVIVDREYEIVAADGTHTLLVEEHEVFESVLDDAHEPQLVAKFDVN